MRIGLKPARCKNKQCGAEIAYINGPNRYLECPKCGRRQKVHHPPSGVRFKMAARKEQ